MKKQTDFENLLNLAKKGDPEAFDAIYKEFLTPVYRYIFLRIRHKETTQDLTQAVFIKIFKSLNKINDFEHPLAYFFTVSRNTVIDYYRSAKHTENLPDDIFLEDTTSKNANEALNTEADLNQVKKAIIKLSPEQKEIILLKYFQDLTNKEISQLLGKSEEAVRQLQSRAIKKIRELLS